MASCFFNWDSWFFTRWIPGLTVTICNKITVHFLNKINWENLQCNKRSTNFLFCHHFSSTFLLLINVVRRKIMVVNLGKNTGPYKMNTALTKSFEVYSVIVEVSDWFCHLLRYLRSSSAGWLTKDTKYHTCRWWYLSAASCFKNLVDTSL